MPLATPKVLDYDLVNRVSNSAWSIAYQTLQQFSVNRLRELKIVTRSYTKGLNYQDVYMARTSNAELLRKLIRKATKQITFSSEIHPDNPYMTLHDGYIWVHLKVINDPSITRYISRLNIGLSQLEVPFSIHTADDGQIPDLLNIYFQAQNTGTSTNFYRTLIVLPEILQVLKTLSRKAYFTNDSIRHSNRSSRAIRQISSATLTRTVSDTNTQTGPNAT